MHLSPRSKLTALGLIAALGLSSCGDYLSNRDRISPHTGDATEANTAIQSIYTWPRAAYNTRIRP